jgi:hypothetical protein
VPKCIAEDLSESRVTVKCGWINNDKKTYGTIPFTFAAFGNEVVELKQGE